MTISRRTLLGASATLVTSGFIATSARLGTPDRGSMSEGLIARTPDGLNLAVRSYGDPAHPEILFIHGLGQSRLSWDLQVNGDLADRFRVVTFDLRGHGDSDKPLSPSAYSDGDRWADDIQAVIEATKLRRPLLVGWSLGGLVIGRYLVRYGAENIAGVNLVDAVTKLSADLLGAKSLKYAPLLADPDLSVRSGAVADFLVSCFAIQPPEEALRRMLVFNGMVPPELHKGVVAISSDGLDDAFAKPEVMLVTYGGKDALTKREMSTRMLSINPRAVFSEYPNSGHSPFYEEPQRFNSELEKLVAA
ncbi:alpha/beta hydrolase [Agrobacterium sp. a22-2]|uniref:alpha/beta fold hydrolase n=1 Tax=Agrobacterium sp. a22-2 TaxID=2283840 RepID=UPI001446DD0A|nr:alpha/beta hydrolase [Agrobacterium sp. a22-2]NKN39086.1 alpha/beta hydrolase [Agrobacterium sp. a22-2]